MLISSIILLILLQIASSNGVDPNGYLVYCPCMGKHSFIIVYSAQAEAICDIQF